mmetsp:Transcript_106159/g.167636  ORF Transcript_106159/g.167636 Transcript_106159/m.167636 type:complete len:457 (+) Transcript_106159:67-1437(+)
MVATTLSRLGVVLFLGSAVQAAFDSERRSSEVALEQDASGLHNTRGDLALHLRKASRGLRGLRARRSSHQHFATAFRSAEAFGRQSSETMRQEPFQAPLYVPKIGLANVTEPTALPPPPPPLEPWKDMQPIDTAVGHYLISGFVEQPTASPPPTQMSLDLAFGCPALLTWPSEVAVSAPDLCTSISNGNWTGGQGGSLLINWEKACFQSGKQQLASGSAFDVLNPNPLISYTMPNGDLFGTSQEQTSWQDSILLRDCGGAVVYSVEEKMYKQEGKANEEICQKYNSCDGVVYIQYFIKDKAGTIQAQTPYLTLFQESFDITNPSGVLIAKASRNGWDPPIQQECTSANPRVWNLKYESTAPGIWATATNQWPIAMMMTMVARRDFNRRPDGSVEWGTCEALRSTSMVFFVLAIVSCVLCTPFVIFLLCSGPCHHLLYDVEQSSFPKRMGKPSKYGN